MSTSSCWHIEVPATSANLGVGYDCLGMALDLKAEFEFSPSEELLISGCEERFQNEGNLVWTCYRDTCKSLGFGPDPLAIHISSPIPLSGGLGSSSTCVVAGIAAAQLIHTGALDTKRLLRQAASIEGHPDNVAPAILGGVVGAFLEEHEVFSVRMDVSKELRFIAVAPRIEVHTQDARSCLPSQVSLELANWQMSRCIPTIYALAQGDLDLFSHACKDRLHEPYRSKLIPTYESAKCSALRAGAQAFYISGSGATMIAVCKGEQTANAIAQTLQEDDPGAWVRICSASPEGISYRKAN